MKIKRKKVKTLPEFNSSAVIFVKQSPWRTSSSNYGSNYKYVTVYDISNDMESELIVDDTMTNFKKWEFLDDHDFRFSNQVILAEGTFTYVKGKNGKILNADSVITKTKTISTDKFQQVVSNRAKIPYKIL